MSEKFCIKWNGFQDITNKAIGSLRTDSDFSDVTLVCEDGEQIEAHKFLLAASTPFFQNLLNRNKHIHPLIYMRGVRSMDLVAIVDFLYYGEANIHEENIDQFLALAKELKLKGLTENSVASEPVKKRVIKKVILSTQKEKEIENIDTTPKYAAEETAQGTLKLNTILPSHNNAEKGIKSIKETLVKSYSDAYDTLTEVDNAIKSMIVIGKTMRTNGKQKNSCCTVCGKEDKYSHIKSHIEAQHFDLSIPCNYCSNVFKSRDLLRHHTKVCKFKF